MPALQHPSYARTRKAAEHLFAVGWSVSEVSSLELGLSQSTLYRLYRETVGRVRNLREQVRLAEDLQTALEAERA